MTAAKIIFSPGIGTPANKIEIDGADLAALVTSANVSIRAGGHAMITLDVFLSSCEVDAAGMVQINGTPVSNEIGREIYESLKRKFEP